jgi:acyl-CoA thioesterase-1
MFAAFIFSQFLIVWAQKNIVFLGDSLTEGYLLDQNKAYPALIQKKIDEKKLNYKVVNAGISGSTSASGPTRLKWYLKQPLDILVLALGANDGLRGVNLKETEKNLKKTIQIAVEKKVKILLVGMKLPPNYGKEFSLGFEKLYQKLAQEEKLPLVPFMLKDVGGMKELNLPDGIHPNEKGHQVVANTIWEKLGPML